MCALHHIRVCLTNDALKAKDPEKYSVTAKPPEINIYNNGPRGRAPATNPTWPPQQPTQPPNFPYGYYPSPYMMPPQWYPPPPPSTINPIPPAVNLVPAVRVEYPKISPWLIHCDQHPARSGEDFSLLAQKFSDEGFRRIHQLTGDRISVEKLSDWLGIGKGTADLLIRYAEEDVEFVKAGTFVMALMGSVGDLEL